MTQEPDPYRTLGVGRDASADEIKSAHRRLAKRYHPDRAGGDRARFVAVQEAYQLLTDPLRRREWDARNGPVRADDRRARSRPATGAARPAPPRPAARSTGPRRSDASDRRTADAPPAGREPGSYTWSARSVPWWETDGPTPPRRPPGRQRPRAPAEPGRGDAGPRTGRGPAPDQPHAFDPYSRSSGAAWSQASRAYFRRHTDDLPRGRARAEPGARPGQPRGAPEPTPRQQGQGGVRGGPAASHRFTSQGPQLGTVRMRASAAQGLRRPWPSLPERILTAAAAWVPPALIVAYGGGALTGCDRASVDCPAVLPLIQAGVMAALFAALLVLPRVAFVAAIGSAGLAVGAALLLLTLAAVGAPSPLPEGLAVFTLVGWSLTYVSGIWLALRDRPVARPWLHRPLAAMPERVRAWPRRPGVTGRPLRGR